MTPTTGTQSARPDKKDEEPTSKLSLDTVDYDEEGKVAVSGRAPEGSRVQLYLDDKPVGGAVRRDEQDETGASIRVRRAAVAWNGGRA